MPTERHETPGLAILTPTYRHDLECFRDLHASVLRHTGADVVHHIVVPAHDRLLFSQLASPRLTIHSVGDFLPSEFLSVYGATEPLHRLTGLSMLGKVQAINLYRPWPPIRGWILQQIVKFAAVARLDAQVVVTADSDVALVQDLVVSDFRRDGIVRFLRVPDAVTSALPNHLVWHAVARRLLGLPPVPSGAQPDYIAGFLAWDPEVVRRMQARIRAVTGLPWERAMASQLHFSECILYGTYIDLIEDASHTAFATSDSLCRSHWEPRPLEEHELDVFLQSLRPSDLAIQIQSTSKTAMSLRRKLISATRERLAARRSIRATPAGRL